MNPETSNWQALTERVEKLEGQNRRLKQIGAVVLVIAAAVLLMGQASPNRTVEANEFILTDSGGRERAKLHMASYGPELVLKTGKAQARLAVGGTSGGFGGVKPYLVLHDETGEARVSLDVGRSGPDLTFRDGSGQTRANLHLLEEGPVAVLYDKDKKVLWKAP